MRRLQPSNVTVLTLAIALSLGIGGSAGAADQAEPGLMVRIYDIGQTVPALPEIVAGQLPNAVKVVPTLDLQDERKDFDAFENNFMTEVLGSVKIEKAGNGRFRLISDDGARLWIDGKLAIDHDGLHGPDPKDSDVLQLSAGLHELRVLHFQGTGGARLTLQWQPPGSAKDAFELIAPAALSHTASLSKETAAGVKKIIPPLRRGRPGDGTPVSGMHPGYRAAGGSSVPVTPLTNARFFTMASPAAAWKSGVVAWLPGNPKDYTDFGAGTLGEPPYQGHLVIPGAPKQDSVRVFPDAVAPGVQGAAFRFAVSDEVPLIAPTGRPVFEMISVRAMSNGFQIEFGAPLDPRVGWDPESYYVEQWPFDLAKGVPPTRDGVVYPVKSASVSADRTQVFLEIPDLKLSHVVYIRLLPPCLSETGELPWATEVWYTLNALPKDSPGDVLPPPPKAPQNVLTEDEKKAGWRLLFDGETLKGWHGYKKTTYPEGWRVIDHCLVRVASAGDIVTDDDFDNFELSIEWRISPGGNSGIMYRVTEDHGAPYETGPEYQILDNGEHHDGENTKTSAASNYALNAPTRDMTGPIGLFNKTRIIVQGNHVEHWLNDVKVVEYEMNSPEWKQLVKDSKFAAWPDFGQRAKGKIDLQDHGDKVWYRNIKIRALTAKAEVTK